VGASLLAMAADQSPQGLTEKLHFCRAKKTAITSVIAVFVFGIVESRH
jgi:hypothetical protein